jgi:hypothetical protein
MEESARRPREAGEGTDLDADYFDGVILGKHQHRERRQRGGLPSIQVRRLYQRSG